MTNLTNPGHHGADVVGAAQVAAERQLAAEIEQAAEAVRAEELAAKRPRRSVLLLLLAWERRGLEARPANPRADVVAALEAALGRASD